MRAQSLVPFSKSKDYHLLSQRRTRTRGELWQKVSEAGHPTGKIVGYQKLSEPRLGQHSSSTINWSNTHSASSETKYLKCKITLNSARQKLRIIDRNKYGAEDNNQSFVLPCLHDFSLQDRFKLALGRNKILMELKQNDFGAWELKIDSKKTHHSQKLRAFSPTLISRNESLASNIAFLNGTIDQRQKFSRAKQTRYQYISQYLSTIDDPSNLIPKNFFKLSEEQQKDIFRKPINHHSAELEKLLATQPKKGSEEAIGVSHHSVVLLYLAKKAQAFFPNSISELSPRKLDDIIKRLPEKIFAKLIMAEFQSKTKFRIDSPDYYDLEQWYENTRTDTRTNTDKQTAPENQPDRDIFFLNKALQETFKSEQTKEKNKHKEKINLTNTADSAFSKGQVSGILKDLINAFYEPRVERGNHAIINDRSLTHDDSKTTASRPPESPQKPLCSLEDGISALNLKLQQIYGLKLAPNTQDTPGNIRIYSLISDEPGNPETLGKIAITVRQSEEQLGTSYFKRFTAGFPYAKSKLPPDTGMINLLLTEKPTPKEQPKLNALELITLFHEAGHVCENFLCRQQQKHLPIPQAIPFDLVETPSQLLEFFAADEDVAKTINDANPEHIQNQIRDSLSERDEEVGVNLVVSKAIFEVLSEERPAAPKFDDFMKKATDSLPNEIRERFDKDNNAQSRLKACLLGAIQKAMGGEYREKLHCYPLNRLLAAAIKNRITKGGINNTALRAKLIDWYNGNSSDPTQSFTFLNEEILENWSPKEAPAALNMY